MSEPPAPTSRLRRLRDFLLRPSALSLSAVVAIGMISGLVFWGGFNTGMEATNTLGFCTSCHEMRDTVFQEYKQTVHYTNRSGVRAVCSDCHVPKDWSHKFVRKIQASQELFGKFITGGIDTPEKFEAKRMELAQHVWKTMKDERFARMPQLPLMGRHESGEAASAGPDADGQGAEGRQDVHRLPQGHRAPAAQGIQRRRGVTRPRERMRTTGDP